LQKSRNKRYNQSAFVARDFDDLPPSEAECVMSNFSFLLFIVVTATILCEKKDLSDGKAQSARETICSTTEVRPKDPNVFLMRKRKVGKTFIIINVTVGGGVKDD